MCSHETFFTYTHIIIWFLIFQYKRSQATRLDKQATEAFWRKEREANTTRRADLSQLNYIQIPLERLPFRETKDESLQLIQNAVRELAGKQIVNLTGISNTDLKLKYGAPNIDKLSEYDGNFTLLVRNLNQWGQYLYGNGFSDDARTVLEFSIQCKSDVRNTYLLLARIYSETGHTEKIQGLIKAAETLNTILKNSILDALKKY